LWKDNAYFLAGEIKYNLEFGEAMGVELDQGYAVRVRAINAAGPGPWSLDSEQIICRHKALKPKVTIKSEHKEVTLKAGDTMTFWADVKGEPVCEDIAWSLNGSQLLEGNGVVVDNSKPYRSMVQKEGISRKDIGVLTCSASNLNGKSSAQIKVNVVGKPSMPEDRLLVSNVHRSGCRLTWGACKDDGGLPVEYVIEKFVAAADAWSKAGAVTGTAFEVNDLEVGREYAFAVRAVNAEGESDALPTAKTMVAKDAYTIPLPPMAPEVTDWSEHHMKLSWKEPIDDGGAAVTGYHVEAKSRGDEEWQLWDTVDTNRTWADMQKLQKGKEYQFRIIAINKAGKSDPSSASRFKEAKAQHLAPYMESKKLHDVTLVFGDRLKFDVPIFGEPAPEVVWTFEPASSSGGDANEPVALSSTPDRNVVVTSSDTQAKLVINSVTKKFAGKFVLTVSNASGSDSAKAEVKVLDRPAAPEGLQATVEGTTCSLLWKKSKDDGGAPIEHYQVERFDFERGQWMAVGKSSASDNSFKSRGMLPGREYKFRVSAVNEYGDSDVAEAKDSVVAVEDVMDASARSY